MRNKQPSHENTHALQTARTHKNTGTTTLAHDVLERWGRVGEPIADCLEVCGKRVGCYLEVCVCA